MDDYIALLVAQATTVAFYTVIRYGVVMCST